MKLVDYVNRSVRLLENMSDSDVSHFYGTMRSCLRPEVCDDNDNKQEVAAIQFIQSPLIESGRVVYCIESAYPVFTPRMQFSSVCKFS